MSLQIKNPAQLDAALSFLTNTVLRSLWCRYVFAIRIRLSGYMLLQIINHVCTFTDCTLKISNTDLIMWYLDLLIGNFKSYSVN